VRDLIHRPIWRSHDAVFDVVQFERTKKHVQIFLSEYFETDDFLAFRSDDFYRFDSTGKFIFGDIDDKRSLRCFATIDSQSSVNSRTAFEFGD